MNGPQTITQDMVRTAVQSFCRENKTVSNAQLYQVLGLTQEAEKNRLRTRIGCMIRSGEVSKVGRGVYTYNTKYRLRDKTNTSFPKIWRFIRMEAPGWCINDVCRLTGISYTQVLRYCAWLENADYIKPDGKKGMTTLYRATAKASTTPETPYPPTTDKNPFEKENAAAAKLARLMLCHDPYQSRVAHEIVAACHVLLSRFGTTCKQNENDDAR